MKNLSKILILTLLLTCLNKNVWALGPSTNLDDYVMFAFTNMIWKGKNSFGGDVIGGNIGVNRVSPNSSTPTMTLGDVNMSPNTQVVADSLRINDTGTEIYDLYTNKIFGNPVFTLNGIQSTYSAPLFSSVPSLFSPFSANNNDIQVPTNGVLNLAPGTYGDIDINDGAILRLGSGTYTFGTMNLGKKVKLYTQPDTIIQIDGTFAMNDLDYHMNDQSYVGSEDPNSESVALFRVLGSKMNFGHNSTFYGIVLAPYADVDLGGGMNLYGRFVVDQLSGDPNNTVNYRRGIVPEPASVVLFATGVAGAFFRRKRTV